MQREVQRQPEDLRVSNERDAEEDRDCDHDAERDGRISHAEDEIEERPGNQRCHYGEGVPDRNVRQKISALAHEEVSAARAAFRAIEVAAKQFALAAYRASQSQQRAQLHGTRFSVNSIYVPHGSVRNATLVVELGT